MHASAPENAGLPGGAGAAGTAAARRAGSPPRTRALAAAPAVGFVLVVVVFYLVEASLRPTPWVFTDELEWTQISRAIAATGHAARRGQPVFFKSLYAYLIAPAWWIHSTARAYSLIKDLNALVMCLAAVPAFLLARMLCPRRAAATVAVLTISIPAMSYATSIIPEPLAYLWFTTTAWLSVRALASPRRTAVALAVAAAALGPLVQKEFVVLPAAGLLAAAGLWVVAAGARASRPARVRRTLLALVGLALFGYLFNLLVVERLNRWVPSQYLNRHTLSAGGLAAGALAIGLGMGPVIGGLASLALPERRGEPAYRAFSAYLVASLVTLWVYTAAKVTYLAGSTPLIEERNLFFLSPLLLCGSALLLAARRVDWRVVAAATALTAVTIWSAQLEVGAPYFEAPGLAILTLVNRSFGWTVQDVHLFLGAAAAVFLALLALRGRRGVTLLAVALAGAWLLTGEVYATVTDNDEARTFAAKLPPPRDWVDRASGGAPVAFLGESIADPNPIWLTEFWNRSLNRVGSLTGDAPGPGPALAPTLTNPDGTLNEYSGDPFTLAGPGVVLQAAVVESVDNDTLYRTPRRWRLLQTEEGVYSDGWMSAYALVAYFAPGGPGRLRIDLSRTAYNGSGPAARATIRVGPLRIDAKGAPLLARTVAVRAATVPDGKEVTLVVPVAATPVAAIITIDTRTLVSIPGDPRLLGALVGFSFHRDRR
jgi:hypothetical protein